MNIESFFKMTYGIYIVSSASGQKLNGYISNTVFQVTAEPPQLAVSCHKDNLTTRYISESRKFSVSVLKQAASPDLIGTFGYKSGRDVNKFTSVDHYITDEGIPIVTQDAAAVFECEVISETDLGTHILFIGRVLNGELLDAASIPMTYAYYREVKKGFSPKNAPTFVDPAKLLKAEISAVPDSSRFQCAACNFVYDPAVGDPDGGIAPGTAFEDIPDDWVCPVCGATKDMFEKLPD